MFAMTLVVTTQSAHVHVSEIEEAHEHIGGRLLMPESQLLVSELLRLAAVTRGLRYQTHFHLRIQQLPAMTPS